MSADGESLHAVVVSAEDINREHRLARECAESAVEHAARCGELLIATKAGIAHGDFLTWLTTHCPCIAERTARAYMRLHREMAKLEPAKRQRVADLSLRNALQVLAEGSKAVVSVVRDVRDQAQRSALYAPVATPQIIETPDAWTTTDERSYSALLDGWERATPAARAQFLRDQAR